MRAGEWAPAAIYRRAQAFTDLHFYQKWRAAWPILARLPRQGIRLLDAGCGDGQWSVEIARRRPGWTVVGVDRDAHAVQTAIGRQRMFQLANVSFERADFAHFAPSAPFDVVLSVCAAHYEPTADDTGRLFRQLKSWMAQGGQMLLVLPRSLGEAPFMRHLSHPAWHRVFTRDGLEELCRISDLEPAIIAPRVGRIGTLAKQIDWARERMGPITSGPVGIAVRAIAMVDAHLPVPTRRSLMWVVLARRQRPA